LLRAAKEAMNGATLGGRALKVNYGKESEIIGIVAAKVEPPPPEYPPPYDTAVQTVIDTFVNFVIKNGPSFEALTKEVVIQ
jgi:hypothetical protein